MTERSFVMDELGDPDAPVGSRPWCLYVANQIRTTLYDAQQSGARLRNLIEAFKKNQGFQELGFLSWEDFCQKRLQSQAEELEATINKRIAAQEMAERYEAKPLNGHLPEGGSNPMGLGGKTGKTIDTLYYNVSMPVPDEISSQQGTSPSYLTRRIARDRPDIIQRMKAGEFTSVHAAAKEAGIVKDKFQMPTDAAAAGRYLAGRVDNDWMLACYDAFMKSLERK